MNGIILIGVLLAVGDLYFYARSLSKYGSRMNFYPLSGYYEWFIKKGK